MPINTSIDKKNKETSCFIQFGNYISNKKRTDTCFRVIYDITLEELKDYINQMINDLVRANNIKQDARNRTNKTKL